MTPKLYCIDGSGPARSVYMTAAAIDLEIEKQIVNLLTGEHLSEEFLKLNPLHTVPTLQDGDFVIYDSHAINAYLVGKYAASDALYPRDLKKRAVIDQRMHFNSGVMFQKFGAIMGPIIKDGVKVIPKEKAEAAVTAYETLNTLLSKGKYAAGDELSIADFSLVTTTTSLNILVPIDETRFPNIVKWIELMKTLPYYGTTNAPGLEMAAGLVNHLLGR